MTGMHTEGVGGGGGGHCGIPSPSEQSSPLPLTKLDHPLSKIPIKLNHITVL